MRVKVFVLLVVASCYCCPAVATHFDTTNPTNTYPLVNYGDPELLTEKEWLAHVHFELDKMNRSLAHLFGMGLGLIVWGVLWKIVYHW